MTDTVDGTEDGEPTESLLLAHRCTDGHLNYPSHPTCTTCGAELVETVDLTQQSGQVITWTQATTTPPGVREPNTLAIVEFTVEEETVRVLGGTTDEVAIGDTVRPVFVERLRDPEQAIRRTESQSWGGFRFEPVDDER